MSATFPRPIGTFSSGSVLVSPAAPSRTADRHAKDRFGFGAYLFAFLEGLAEGRSAVMKVEVDGETHAVSGQSAIVANVARVDVLGQSMGTRVSPHDRALDCLVLDHTDPRLFMDTVAKFFGSGPKDPAGLVHHHGKRFRIEAESGALRHGRWGVDRAHAGGRRALFATGSDDSGPRVFRGAGGLVEGERLA